MLLGFSLLLAPLTALAAPAPFNGVYGSGAEKFTLATGSPGELGLVKALADGFDKAMQGQITLQWLKAGSGKSLQLLKD
jgi:tungstate transport system substrate-binding protein